MKIEVTVKRFLSDYPSSFTVDLPATGSQVKVMDGIHMRIVPDGESEAEHDVKLLAERAIAHPIIGIPSAKDFARQCDPFEPDSETTTGTCAHWRDKVEKVFAHVRGIMDEHVERIVSERVRAAVEEETLKDVLMFEKYTQQKIAQAIVANDMWWASRFTPGQVEKERMAINRAALTPGETAEQTEESGNARKS